MKIFNRFLLYLFIGMAPPFYDKIQNNNGEKVRKKLLVMLKRRVRNLKKEIARMEFIDEEKLQESMAVKVEVQ